MVYAAEMLCFLPVAKAIIVRSGGVKYDSGTAREMVCRHCH